MSLAALPANAGTWVSGTYANTAGSRRFQLWVPSGYQSGTATPLVVALHGCSQSPSSFAGSTRFNQLADANRILVLYPEQGLLNNFGRCWNWMLPTHQRRGSGEPSILTGMVGWVRARYSVDSHRVYVAGISAGGAMAAILAACYSDVFAAGAVHSGLMFRAATSVSQGLSAASSGSPYDPDMRGIDAWTCANQPQRAFPLLVFHGTGDSAVAPLNGDQVVQQSCQTNDLGDDGADNDSVPYSPSSVESGSVPGGRSYEIESYAFGGQLLVRKYTVFGMSHAWSGGDGRFAFTDPSGPNATQILWDFFRTKSR